MDNQHGSSPFTWQTGCAVTLCAVVVASFVKALLDRRMRNPNNLPLPPGPPKLPFFGNMFDPVKPGPVWEVYTDLAHTYGDMYYLKQPRSSILVLNSVTAINDLVE